MSSVAEDVLESKKFWACGEGIKIRRGSDQRWWKRGRFLCSCKKWARCFCLL